MIRGPADLPPIEEAHGIHGYIGLRLAAVEVRANHLALTIEADNVTRGADQISDRDSAINGVDDGVARQAVILSVAVPQLHVVRVVLQRRQRALQVGRSALQEDQLGPHGDLARRIDLVGQPLV